jgi:hypothetical protein
MLSQEDVVVPGTHRSMGRRRPYTGRPACLVPWLVGWWMKLWGIRDVTAGVVTLYARIYNSSNLKLYLIKERKIKINKN